MLCQNYGKQIPESNRNNSSHTRRNPEVLLEFDTEQGE